MKSAIEVSIKELASEHANVMIDRGWLNENTRSEDLLINIHSEISEANEVFRREPDKMSEKIPIIPAMSEELADIILGSLGLSEYLDIDIGLEIVSVIEGVYGGLVYSGESPKIHWTQAINGISEYRPPLVRSMSRVDSTIHMLMELHKMVSRIYECSKQGQNLAEIVLCTIWLSSRIGYDIGQAVQLKLNYNKIRIDHDPSTRKLSY